MKFKKALKAMKEGKTVSRGDWSNYTARLKIPSCRSSSSQIEHMCIVWSKVGVEDFWLVDVSDYEADDWYIVGEES